MKWKWRKAATWFLAAIIVLAGVVYPSTPGYAQWLPSSVSPYTTSIPMDEVTAEAEPVLGQVISENEHFVCFITGVTDGTGTPPGYGFEYTTDVAPITGEGSFSLPNNERGWVDVTETWAPDSIWQPTDNVAMLVFVGNAQHYMVQLPAGVRTVIDVHPQAGQWTSVGTEYSLLPYGQTGRVYVNERDVVSLVDKFLIYRCYARPQTTPQPTAQPTQQPDPTPQPTPAPSRTPYPDPDDQASGMVIVSQQGQVVSNDLPMCYGIAALPVVGGNMLPVSAAQAMPDQTPEPGRYTSEVCEVEPIEVCNIGWDNIWQVVTGNRQFGDFWVCKDVQIDPSSEPVVLKGIVPFVPGAAQPQIVGRLGGALVGAGLWSSYSISRLQDDSDPLQGIIVDSLEGAEDWVAGQMHRPATIHAPAPMRVEQYIETEPSAYSANGPYYGTFRWYQPDYEGEVTLIKGGFQEWSPETILTAQMLEGAGTASQIRVVSYEVRRGRHEGGDFYSSVDDGVAAIFATQVVMPDAVDEAPEVEHVKNHPRKEERDKKIAGWRLAYRDWFDFHNNKGGKGPNWCGQRDDGAYLIVFYAIQVMKTTGGSFKGVGLILHTDGSSFSTVMSDVKPRDEDINGRSAPKGPTFEPFHEIPCPPPYVPST